MNVMAIAVALIRDPAGRVLLVRKQGTAAFMQPGGKLDAGEDTLPMLAPLTREHVLPLAVASQ
jgi:8-oxo-dGTP diphosphatase